MSYKDKLIETRIPQHIAIIMDGNGRWAAKRGNNRIFGHKKGAKTVKAITEAAGEIGVKYLTLYAFSTENWKRPSGEVESLMSLLVSSINNELNNLVENNIRLVVIGDFVSLPSKVNLQIQEAIQKTAHCTGLTVNIALSYSSRWEIIDSVKRLAYDIKYNNLDIDKIDSSMFERYLHTSDIPDPELLIRTSGEKRISNFLLWQIAYSELYFSPKLWPDFTKEDLYMAIYDYQKRERRFGKTSAQITKIKQPAEF
jgi:undecaprenyl diphosphate synthase